MKNVMFLVIVFIFIFLRFSLQQAYHDCFDHEIIFDTHAYLSTPDFPKTLPWDQRSNCYFEFKNRNPILLIFTNAYLCNIVVKTKNNETLTSVLNTNVGYYQFEGTFLSMHLLSNFNETDSKCDWQAFQAFAYDTTVDSFEAQYSEILNKDLIYAVATDSDRWIIEDDVFDGVITIVKVVLHFSFQSSTDVIVISVGLPDHHYRFDYEHYYDQPIQYFSDMTVLSSISLSLDLDSKENSSFYFFVSLAEKSLEWNSNCLFEKFDSNEWIFSLYNTSNGYGHNTHCITKVLTKEEGYQYELWFEKYHVEPNFDNVTVDTSFDFRPVLLKNSKYVVSYTDFLLKFDSDFSINQAGFVLHIQKYACDCGDSVVVIPCDGSRKRRYFLNQSKHYLYCEISCSIQIRLEENCMAHFFEIYYYCSSKAIETGLELEFYCSDGNFSLASNKLLHYYDRVANSNYSIVRSIQNIYESLTVTDVGDFKFWLDFKVPLDLKTMTVILNSTNWIFHEKLTNLDKTIVTVRMDSILQNKNFNIDFFVNSDYHNINDIDVYENAMKEYTGSFKKLSSHMHNLMPYMITRKNEFSFYYENVSSGNYYLPGIVFLRIRELDTKNCMFEHNVIDRAGFYDVPFTMVNNGSGLCKSTFLNILKNNTDPGGFYNFWTNSEKNVVIVDQNQKRILEFNKRNASKIPLLEFPDNFYQVLLEPNSSVTFNQF